ncbi:sulfotransferase family protein [Pelagovum pacificum]|nr:sulfotransferase [Pelagovum pacificum]QQA41926.1 sulfotransferase [Pelagovum pacificum]
MQQRDPVDVIVIGAMRAGTTSLHRMFTAHDQIAVPNEKEVDFFLGGDVWEKGERWYRRRFSDHDLLRVEVSPNYSKCLSFPFVPERVATVAPACRFIYLVRDPVNRAVSQHHHATRSDAAGEVPDISHLIEVSSYALQLRAWLECFPIERFMVLDQVRLFGNEGEERARLASFLGVEDNWMPPSKANSTAELAGIPDWFFSFRKTGVGRLARRWVPHDAKIRLKAALASNSSKVPEVDTDLREKIAQGVRADAAQFRALTRQEFADWSV